MLRFLLLFLFVGSFSHIIAQDYANDIAKHRKEYKEAFLKSSNSPLKEDDLLYLDFFDADESYKVECKFKFDKNSVPFELPTYSGITKTYQKFGTLHFKINGKKQTLAVYRSLALAQNPLYRDYIFLPFKDLTNAKVTYGGGRYLDLRMKDLEAKPVIIDFNEAYNPYCAYSDGYNCPIPPQENHLKIEIVAGEKKFMKEH